MMINVTFRAPVYATGLIRTNEVLSSYYKQITAMMDVPHKSG